VETGGRFRGPFIIQNKLEKSREGKTRLFELSRHRNDDLPPGVSLSEIAQRLGELRVSVATIRVVMMRSRRITYRSTVRMSCANAAGTNSPLMTVS